MIFNGLIPFIVERSGEKILTLKKIRIFFTLICKVKNQAQNRRFFDSLYFSQKKLVHFNCETIFDGLDRFQVKVLRKMLNLMKMWIIFNLICKMENWTQIRIFFDLFISFSGKGCFILIADRFMMNWTEFNQKSMKNSKYEEDRNFFEFNLEGRKLSSNPKIFSFIHIFPGKRCLS
jgi:hypothetical protein